MPPTKTPIRIIGQESCAPMLTTGTIEPRRRSGTYSDASCIACPHSCAATPIAATEVEPYTLSDKFTVLVRGS